MTTAADRHARILADFERRLRAIERTSQTPRTSVQTDAGETLVLSDAVARGVAGADVANTALASANGKNRVTYSDVDPVDPGTTVGDVYFKRDVSGVVLAQWEWDGAAWQPITLGHEVIASLDLGKATVGVLTGGFLAADAIDGKTITGATVQTAASGQRWKLSSAVTNTLQGYTGSTSEFEPGRLYVNEQADTLNASLVAPRVLADPDSGGGSVSVGSAKGTVVPAFAGLSVGAYQATLKGGSAPVFSVTTPLEVPKIKVGSGASAGVSQVMRKGNNTWTATASAWTKFVPGLNENNIEDDGGLYQGSGNFAPVVSGWHHIAASVSWPTGTGSHRALRIANSGNTRTWAVAYLPTTAPFRTLTVTWTGYLATTDVVSVFFYHDSGSALTMPVETATDPQRITFVRLP